MERLCGVFGKAYVCDMVYVKEEFMCVVKRNADLVNKAKIVHCQKS